ncbi:MAG: preprotein translocase subunit SecG [Nitrospirae bacterium]|nr:preprotein translocase subunit SecG [Nitrospirota bacterium]MBF0535697.1 preprotein translocase subunit SecG [Nitrospirota bacterium]MBF0617522.1 preprotein translocase subunit SecG [Nitrospirota bacterium]
MHILLLIVHVLVCVFLIFVVLVQSSKGSQMGAAFGGSSQTIFGARGAATFLAKATTTTAVIFMVTALLLAVYETRKTSIVTVPQAATKSAPANSNLPLSGAGVAPKDEQNKNQSKPPQAAPSGNTSKP